MIIRMCELSVIVNILSHFILITVESIFQIYRFNLKQNEMG